MSGPLFRVSKRAALTPKEYLIYYSIALLAAIVAGGLFILLMRVNPFTFYYTVVAGCFMSTLSKIGLVRIIVPLLIASLGVAVAFRMKFWNIGAEGQFIMGAVGATFVALNFSSLPQVILVPLMALAGIFLGGIWGMLVAFFKCRFGTNETLLTLMLNYIALNIIQYLRDGPWRDPIAGGFPKIPKMSENAWIPQIWKLDISFLVALVLVVLITLYLKKTKQGYEISVISDSIDTARYAGMNVNAIIMRTMFISAAVAGLGGMLQVAGDATSHTLSMGIASGVGFTAIIVAWLGRLSPVRIMIISCLFGILEKGCGVAQSTFGVSSAVSDILQGIILFMILGADFFITYKVTFSKSGKGGADHS